MDTNNQDISLLIMAAGMGSRFGGLKQMASIDEQGRCIIDYSVYDAVRAGFGKVYILLKPGMEEDFRSVVGRRIESMADIQYIFQDCSSLPTGRVKPYGTGHAVLCAASYIKTPFAVINADDFYGSHSYQILADSLRNSEHYAMVGFALSNTLTENGGVSRGVCRVKNGFLEDIQERHGIEKENTFDESTIVSMNMWGFHTDIFENLEELFRQFLKDNGESLTSEFYIPYAVDKMIRAGRARVRVLETNDRWYGITYKQDKAHVQQAIKGLKGYELRSEHTPQQESE